MTSEFLFDEASRLAEMGWSISVTFSVVSVSTDSGGSVSPETFGSFSVESHSEVLELIELGFRTEKMKNCSESFHWLMMFKVSCSEPNQTQRRTGYLSFIRLAWKQANNPTQRENTLSTQKFLAAILSFQKNKKIDQDSFLARSIFQSNNSSLLPIDRNSCLFPLFKLVLSG